MVITAAIILKIPRFFHFQLTRVNGIIDYETTELMEDPTYIMFNAYWDDLLAIGLLPLLILIYLNAKIYLKVTKPNTLSYTLL